MQVASPLPQKYVAGHVNDDVLTGNFGAGSQSLVFIDHGREPQNLPYSQWEFSYLWRMDKIEGAWRVSEFAQNLGRQFWHSSANPVDVNNDGILDFSVAALSQAVNVLFVSGSSGTFDPVSLTKGSITNCGASALIRLANKRYGSICLPYTSSSMGYVHTLATDAHSISSTQPIAITGIRDQDGFHLIKVTDLNNDGLEDFLGIAEAPDGSAKKSKKIVAFLQDRQGRFTQANDQLGLKVDYSLPETSPDLFADWLVGSVMLGDVNGDGIKDIFFTTALVPHSDVLTKGLRGGYVYENGRYVELSVPAAKIVWNSEKQPATYRFIFPTEINSDGIVDFVMISTTFDQPKTPSNPYGQIFHLSVLTSEIQN